jgi:S1-C subfamily serine protease
MDDKRVIRIVRKVMPAVVSIAIAKHLKDLEKEMPKEFYPSIPGTPAKSAARNANGGAATAEPQFKIPDEMVDARGMVQVGGGSGFIVDPNGLVMTNKHVVNEPDAEYTVIMNDGKTYAAEILSRDPINDVAILKIPAKNLPCLELGDASELQLGQSLIAIGNALGIFRNTVSLGIVSGLSRAITAQADPNAPPQEMRGLIQTDAAINPGNSGGPIVDRDGRVIGVNAAIVSGAQSIGFAIPVNAAKRDLDDIRRYGRIRRPLLGVRYIMVDGDLKKKMKLSVDYGAIVMRESPHDAAVVPNSPAEKAGVQEMDIVLELNGEKLDRDHPIQDFLEDMNVGDEVSLLILRGTKHIPMKVTLTERK